MRGKYNVRKLLKKLSYEVSVHKLSEGCCTVYPLNKINTYTICTNGFVLCDHELNKSYISLPVYAIRVGVMIDIIRKCKEIKYDPRLINFYINNKRVQSLENVLPGEFDKEAELCDILYDGLKYGFSLRHLKLAREFSVQDAYETILDLAESIYE